MINSSILSLGTYSFFASLIIHILIWRLIRPSKHLVWLGIIFIILPLAIYLTFPFFVDISALATVFAFLWHTALSSAYIISYPLFQADCPSLKIILAIYSYMPKGLTEESINKLFSQDILLYGRIEDLVNDGLIVSKNGAWVMSYKGRLLSLVFFIYRRLLGLPPGEG